MRLSYPSAFGSVHPLYERHRKKAKSPFVGIPYVNGDGRAHCFVASRTRMEIVLTCPKVTQAAVLENGNLRLWGKGAEFILYPVKRDWQLKDAMAEWAKRKTKTARPANTTRTERQRFRWQEERVKLMRRIDRFYLGEPPKYLRYGSGLNEEWERLELNKWATERVQRKQLAGIAARYLGASGIYKRNVKWRNLYAELAAAGFSVSYPYNRVKGRKSFTPEVHWPDDYLKSLWRFCSLKGKPWGARLYEPVDMTEFIAERGQWLVRKNELNNLQAQLKNLETLLKGDKE